MRGWPRSGRAAAPSARRDRCDGDPHERRVQPGASPRPPAPMRWRAAESGVARPGAAPLGRRSDPSLRSNAKIAETAMRPTTHHHRTPSGALRATTASAANSSGTSAARWNRRLAASSAPTAHEVARPAAIVAIRSGCDGLGQSVDSSPWTPELKAPITSSGEPPATVTARTTATRHGDGCAEQTQQRASADQGHGDRRRHDRRRRRGSSESDRRCRRPPRRRWRNRPRSRRCEVERDRSRSAARASRRSRP